MDHSLGSTSKILGRLDPRDFLRFYPHSSVPCHNLHKSDFVLTELKGLIMNMSKEFSYNVSYPLPVYAPNFINKQLVNGIDPAVVLVKEKGIWEKYKNHLLKYCSLKQVEKIESNLYSQNTCRAPQNLVLLGNHMQNDPDKYFSSDYNIYYTGGNLVCCEVNSEKFLIRPKPNDSGIILVDHFSQNNYSVCDTESTLEVNTINSGPIYQIESNKDFLITRQKKNVSLFSIKDGERNVNINKEYSVSTSVPFFYTAISSSSFCTVSADRKLEILDINSEKSIISTRVDSDEVLHMSDTLSSAHYVDRNVIFFTDRKCARLIDLRAINDSPYRWPISNVTEHCEEIFCAAPGSGVLEYIVCSHHCLSLDHRAGFCQRWTHGITHSPAYINVNHVDSTDNIFIGSQRKDSVIFINNDCVAEGSASLMHPYFLPSLVESLHQARYNGYCLGNVVSSRFFMNTTGLCSVFSNNTLKLLRATSVGDVFSQLLIKHGQGSNINLNDEDLQVLDKWEQLCDETFYENNKTCSVGDILNDKHLINCITNKSASYVEQTQKHHISSAPWTISKKELLSYCDYLAPKILQVWNIEDLEEWAEENLDDSVSEESLSDDEEDIAERIAKWTETYAEDSTDVVYAFEDLPPISSNTSVSNPLAGTLRTHVNSEHSTTPRNSKSSGTIGKKHISGF